MGKQVSEKEETNAPQNIHKGMAEHLSPLLLALSHHCCAEIGF